MIGARIRSPRTLVRLAGVIGLVAGIVLITRTVETAHLASTWRGVRNDPGAVAVVLALYAAAFALRAWVWTRVLPSLRFGQAQAAIYVSLLGNHVLPLRLGEALRVTSVVRRARTPLADATASTVFLRATDTLAVVGLAAAFAPGLAGRFLGGWASALACAALAVWVAGLVWLRRLAARRTLAIRLPVLVVALGSTAAWLLESAVLWQAARFAGIDLSVPDAVLVTAVTIAAQAFAVAPGGIGTYEAAATAALVAVGADPAAALAAALAAHAFKTAFSLVAGTVALVVPSPSFFGRLRLARRRDPARDTGEADARGPVVLFLPAHDEEVSVARVVARVPSTVCGRRVECLVVDDGSTDATAALAAAAGADVLRQGRNRGLGAAVRAGLAESVERGPAAVAFCDADGEYAPEELERLVAPILAGEADYVVGSRFAGGSRSMRPHRLLGNVVLTRLLRFASRAPISDGQSGYRAFSRRAAADAEVIHDFNYAQVLTLDLLAKGYRYTEVPISYAFRTEGRSFVRLGRYLRHVLPAMHRELNDARAEAV